eukprot:2916907-Prymnesium_polylepis.1
MLPLRVNTPNTAATKPEEGWYERAVRWWTAGKLYYGFTYRQWAVTSSVLIVALLTLTIVILEGVEVINILPPGFHSPPPPPGPPPMPSRPPFPPTPPKPLSPPPHTPPPPHSAEGRCASISTIRSSFPRGSTNFATTAAVQGGGECGRGEGCGGDRRGWRWRGRGKGKQFVVCVAQCGTRA